MDGGRFYVSFMFSKDINQICLQIASVDKLDYSVVFLLDFNFPDAG